MTDKDANPGDIIPLVRLPLRHWLALLFVVLMLSACGGSSGDGAANPPLTVVSGGNPPDAQSPDEESPTAAPVLGDEGGAPMAEPTPDSDSDSAPTPPPEPVAAPAPGPVAGNADIQRLDENVRVTLVAVMIALNDKLAQGETLTAQEALCASDHDPALGRALLEIDCDTPLQLGTSNLLVLAGNFFDEEACQRDLVDRTGAGCRTESVEMQINTAFAAPQGGGRPQPLPGALITLDRPFDSVLVENMEPAVAGEFDCEFSLATGAVVDGDDPAACATLLTTLADRIEGELP